MLTDVAIKNLAVPAKGQAEVWDTRIPGFGVRVSHAGTTAFILVYRYNSRPRRMTQGRYPVLKLSEARELAHAALRKAALGTDPQAQKLRDRRTPTIERFDDFVTYFIETYSRPKNRSADETARLLRREFGRVWGQRPIGEITKQDVTAVLDRLMRAGKHTTANRSLAAIHKLFNWAVERGLIEQSPSAGIRAPANAVSRDRVLSDEEIATILTAASTMGHPFGTLVHILALTGQRRGEVAGLRWTDLDFERALWSLSAAQTKSNRAHLVPLCPKVTKILSVVPRVHPELVFPARGKDNPLSGFPKWKRELDALSGISDWRLHDLRRTAATGMARLRVAPHVVERVLNHTSGSLGGVAGVYNRFGYLDEMRAALELWEAHVGRVLGT